jgi:ubiquinone/menaquinone biosynthesis C-methylase UbiE
VSPESKEEANGYYDSKVQSFFDIWGGENIHFGIFHDGEESLSEASVKTIEKMYSELTRTSTPARVLDLGSGFGGAARYLADKGHNVTCVDASPENNRVNSQLNAERGFDTITVVDGRFESLSMLDESFDVVWSQEAICHSTDVAKVFSEAWRVLKPGGEFALGNTCRSESIPAHILGDLNKRNSLDLQTLDFHSELAKSLGFQVSVCNDMSTHLGTHYRKMIEEVRAKESIFTEREGKKYFDRVVVSLQYWLRMCDEELMKWGIWKLVK